MARVKIEIGQLWASDDTWPGNIYKVVRIDRASGNVYVYEGNHTHEIPFCLVDAEGYYWVQGDWHVVTNKAPPVTHPNGANCEKCQEHFPFAVPNQENGTMICWSCRNYPFYKGRLS